VFAEQRLPGMLKDVPTAKEQGFDISWPIIRGFYMGPKVADADFNAWTVAFQKAMATPGYAKLREERGLFPLSLTGTELDAYVKRHTHQYGKLAAELGLVVTK
jgi:putative tricarboxylic transport membrane protein